MLPFLWNVFVTLRNGEPAGDDPWEGNTLEWATSSPPPPYNFDRLPEIRSERPVFDARHGLAGESPLMTAGSTAAVPPPTRRRATPARAGSATSSSGCSCSSPAR